MQEPMIEQTEEQTDSISANEQIEGGDQSSRQFGTPESQEGQNDIQAPAANQGAPQNWNPQEWTLNYKGQQIVPKDRQHLINLAQKGHGYEQAMEQINQERQKIAQMQGQYKRYIELDEALKQRPEFAQSLWQHVQQLQQPEQQDQEELPPQVQQLQSELEEIKTWKQQLAEQEASKAIDAEIDGLKQQYPSFDWTSDDGTGTLAFKIMKHAFENNLPSMKTAFRDIMFDQSVSKVKIDTLKKQKETQQQQFRQGVVQSSGTSTGTAAKPKTGYSRSDSYGDLVQKALTTLGG